MGIITMLSRGTWRLKASTVGCTTHPFGDIGDQGGQAVDLDDAADGPTGRLTGRGNPSKSAVGIAT
jgi:hypothetical protein